MYLKYTLLFLMNLLKFTPTATTPATRPNSNGNTTMENLTTSVPHNPLELLNIGDIKKMKAYNLPTINEGYYTKLVANLPKDAQFEVSIPEHLDDAYNLGDQYVKRLMNHGRLTNITKRRSGISEHNSVPPKDFRLTAYDCDKPQNIKNLRHRQPL